MAGRNHDMVMVQLVGHQNSFGRLNKGHESRLDSYSVSEQLQQPFFCISRDEAKNKKIKHTWSVNFPILVTTFSHNSRKNALTAIFTKSQEM